jgi:hypothetical protein
MPVRTTRIRLQPSRRGLRHRNVSEVRNGTQGGGSRGLSGVEAVVFIFVLKKEGEERAGIPSCTMEAIAACEICSASTVRNIVVKKQENNGEQQTAKSAP